MLLRGTEIEKQKHLWGLIESNDTMPVVIESNTFTNYEWLQMGNISQALKESENTHPRSIELLEEMIDESNELQHERFQPIISGIESPVLVKIKTP